MPLNWSDSDYYESLKLQDKRAAISGALVLKREVGYVRLLRKVEKEYIIDPQVIGRPRIGIVRTSEAPSETCV